MAKNNAESAAPSGSVTTTAENTPRHKLLAMGQKVTGGANDGKKTKA